MMSEEDEEVLFDRSGDLITDEEHLLPDAESGLVNGLDLDTINVQPNVTLAPTRGRVFQTICLCAAFFGLGLCIAIPGPTLLDLQEQTHTDTEEIARIFTGRSLGYLFGSLVGGFLFDRFNQTCLLSLSLLLTAIGTAAAPWCTNYLFLIGIVAFQGISMGFLDTGGNVLCLYLWGRGSGPYMQAMHFVFGVGAFVAPLLAEPFLSRSNSTNVTIFENGTGFGYDMSAMHLAITVKMRAVREAGDDIDMVTPSLPPLPDNSSTVKPKKPDAANAVFLSQDPGVASGMKIGKKIHENEKLKTKTQPDPSSGVLGPLEGNSTTNETLDTGQDLTSVTESTTTTTTTLPTTTTTTTTTTVPTTTSPIPFEAPEVITVLENGTVVFNETHHDDSSADGTFQKIRNKVNEVVSTVNQVLRGFTKVQFAYLVIAAFILLVSVLFMFQCCCCGRCSCQAIKYHDTLDSYLLKRESTGFRVQILTLLFMFYFLYVGMEVTYGGLIMSFSVNYLKWSKPRGTMVTSVFWGSFAAGRLLAIPLSKCLTPAIMIVADLVLTIFSLAGLVIVLSTNHIMLWFCTATLGIGLASIFPTGITWAERYMHVTGKSTAVFVVGSALGEMALPLLTGFLFQNKGPMWLMYIMMGCAFLCMIVYIIMQNLATNMGERYARVPSMPKRRSSSSNSVPLHSLDSDEEEEHGEMDSVPLITSSEGAEDLQRRNKKVRFNLHAVGNGSVNNHSHSKSTSFMNGSKGSILKSRTSLKKE